MAKYTLGPWHAKKVRTLIHIGGESAVCEISISANHVHEDYPGRKAEYVTRQEANARLVAAAPELLEALIHLHHNAKASRANMGLALDIAKAAIEKAIEGNHDPR